MLFFEARKGAEILLQHACKTTSKGGTLSTESYPVFNPIGGYTFAGIGGTR